MQAWQRRLRFLLVSCVAIAGHNVSADTVAATVYQVSGLSESAAPGSTSFSPLTVGESLPVGTTVRTGADGKAVLTVTPGSAINIGANSKLKLNALAFAKSGDNVTQREAHIEMSSGVVTALVDPSTPAITDFEIQTPQGGASARGTFYAVAVYQGRTFVSVKEGHVGTAAANSKANR